MWCVAWICFISDKHNILNETLIFFLRNAVRAQGVHVVACIWRLIQMCVLNLSMSTFAFGDVAKTRRHIMAKDKKRDKYLAI